MSAAVFEVEGTTRPEFIKEERKPEQQLPPEVVLTQILSGALASQAVYVAAKLGVADLLADGPKPVQELARSCEADASSLYRVLRALASMGVFIENENQVFALTPIAEKLLSKTEGSLRDLAIFMGEDWHWEVWGQTLYSVKTGKSAWAKLHGDDVFAYFARKKEPARVFDNAMTSLTTLAIKAVVEAYDFAGINTLVDIAGGHGRLLTSILETGPSMRGVLFDLPHVIEGARERLKDSKTKERVEFASGDFFVRVPSGADAYIMKHIIHDWDDERALKILRNIREAMAPGGRVLVVESVVQERNVPDLGKLFDIEMLVSPGGKERTAVEYQELFARAGLRLTRIVPTQSAYSVIEAVAA